MAKDENMKMSFLGMKFECTNPTTKTIIILVLLLIFLVALVVLMPQLVMARRWFSG